MADVAAGLLDGGPAVAAYYPVVHNPDAPGSWDWWRPTAMSLVVRTGLADSGSIFPGVRAAVQAVAPAAPVANARTLSGIVAASSARLRFTSLLLGIAAGVALVLAAVGLFGVVAYVVGGRTREIGMRIAVGAEPAEVERMFVRRFLGRAAVGVAAGLALALACTRVLEGLLFNVEPNDPVTLLGAVGILAGVALLATWLPARRVTRVDPVEALRAD